MANTSNITVVPTEATVSPYYDDFDPNKNFHRVLYRPGYAVQARELTQSQSILQNQIANFATNIFQNGSLVSGGQLAYSTAISLNLQSTYANTTVDVTQFANSQIVNVATATNIVSAQVMSVNPATSTDPATLMVIYLSGAEFGSNDTIQVMGQNTFANVATTYPAGNGSIVSIQDGVYYINGFFVNNRAQTISLDKYSTTPTYRVGFNIVESIVDENADATLLDPAQEASNYQAPGATRYKIDLILDKRTLSSSDDSKFIELLRVENGVITKQIRYPTYSVLDDTLARRTYDQSGSFTVRPFVLHLKDNPSQNTSNGYLTDTFAVVLDPGKAYVLGYEFETIAPTTLILNRARLLNNVSNYDLATTYGNYVLVGNVNTTAGATSGLLSINSMTEVDLHCVPYTDIKTANTTVYNATLIGNARIRNLVYEDSANSYNSDAHIFRAYLFNTNFSGVTGNVNYATSNTIRVSNTSIDSQNLLFAQSNTAYYGATISITSGLANGYTGVITNYDYTTKFVTVSPSFAPYYPVPANNDAYTIGFSIASLESIITGSNTITGKANVVNQGKDTLAATGNTVMFETDNNILVFPFPQSPIGAGTLSNQNYSYKKTFTGRTFTAGVGSITAGAGESFSGSGNISGTNKLSNYTVVVTNNNGSTNISNGQILSFTNPGRTVNVSSNTTTFDAGLPGDTFTADVLATVNINTGSETNPKLKTLITANTTYLDTGTANGSLGNANVYLNTGQIRITSPNRSPSGNDVLYISDINNLTKVLDFGTSTITQANLTSAADITSHYTLDTGQRDNLYDHGSIILKSGVKPPSGNIVVFVDYFSHDSGTSDGLGYMSVDSYQNGYANVPSYYSAATGTFYYLRDCIDFRPHRLNASNTYPNFTIEGIRIPIPNSNFVTNYGYYLPRQDKIILTKDRQFVIRSGSSGIPAKLPSDLPTGMTLYNVYVPAYTFSPSNVTVQYIDHKRYTMEDIGKLDKRITNLEYYNSLSQLERQLQTQSVLDANGIDRTKYGTLVDTFTGSSVGDVKNLDYNCAIDGINKQLLPPFTQTSIDMNLVANTNVAINGSIAMMSYTEEPFVSQNVASFAIGINDFLFGQFLGSISLNPKTDIWNDNSQAPDVVINNNGDNDAWQAIGQLAQGVTDSRNPFGTVWNNWQTIWAGSPSYMNSQIVSSGDPGSDIIQRDYYSTPLTQTKVGVTTSLGINSITKQIGNLVVDTAIIPYMRGRNIYFIGQSFRPTRTMYFFFDNTAVTNYVQRSNELTITYSSNTSFEGSVGITETITANNGIQAQAILTWPYVTTYTGNTVTLYVSQATGSGIFVANGTITGNTSGASATIVSYKHWSGVANSVSPGTANTIRLQDAASSTDIYTGNVIYLVGGTGAGQNAVISSYNTTSKVVTISSNWTTTPNTDTRYSIGQIKTTSDGMISGTFCLPNTTSQTFRTGERSFRIIDDPSNILTNSTTNGETAYQAQGLILTQENASISVASPVIQRTSVTQSQIINSVTSQDTVIGTVPYPPPQDSGGWGGSCSASGGGDS